MSRFTKILTVFTLIILASLLYMKYMNVGANFIWSISNGGQWLLPLVVISSLIDSINPCAFSILTLSIAFLFSLGLGRSQVLKIGGTYIFGVFIVYMFIGLGILQVLHIFDTPHFMAKIGAVLLILLGSINLLNEFFPNFPIKLKIPQFTHHNMAVLMEKASMPTAFILGVLVGLCEFPCTGGPYLMVLGLLHDQATYINGLYYLFIYNLIFVLPLLIILFVAGDKGLLAKVEEWKKSEMVAMRYLGGILMILLGVFILVIQ